MHLAVIVFSLLAAWRWGDWRNWQKYHATMMYIALSNLLYNFIYYDHFLWQLNPLLLYSHNIGEIFYTFIVFPSTALLFLTNYPKDTKGQVLRIAKFILIYIVFEWVFHRFGKITYKYGWTIWWSLAWDSMMFPMWALHFKKPLIAYIVSVFIIILVIIIFPVPMKP